MCAYIMQTRTSPSYHLIEYTLKSNHIYLLKLNTKASHIVVRMIVI